MKTLISTLTEQICNLQTTINTLHLSLRTDCENNCEKLHVEAQMIDAQAV